MNRIVLYNLKKSFSSRYLSSQAKPSLEKRVLTLEENVNGIFEVLKDMNMEIKSQKSTLNDMNDSIRQIVRMTSEMRAGMGLHFEKFTASWVKGLLVSRNPDFKYVELESRRKFLDKSRRVVKGANEFEVDLFSLDAAMVVEATTYLKREEAEKWERLVRVKEFFIQELQRNDVQVFLVCLAIDPSVSKKVADFCKTNDIILIAQYN